MPREEEHDGGGRSDGDPDEEHPLPAARVGEKAERRAAVVREHQVEERRDLAHLAEAQADRKSTRLNSSHTVIYTLSLHDALPIWESPAEKRRSPECLARRNTMAAVAATATPMKSILCQPPASARKLNAAPRLCASTRLKNGAISRTSPKRRQIGRAHV